MNTGLESLLWYGLIALAFFFMMRGGCGAHVMGHGRRHHHDEERDQSANSASVQMPFGTPIDPVCGMKVDPGSVRSTVYHGRPYLFCSHEHRDAFEAEPERYVRGSVPTSGREAHVHGCC
jgi:YHS domain-containing protein